MTSKIFLDTNVFLDNFLKREPHWEASARILNMAVYGQIAAYTSSVSFCNINYVLNKLEKNRIVEKDLQFLLNIIQIVPVNGQMLGQALLEALPDYEDSVQYASALKASCDFIITANKRHFSNCKIPVLNASEFVGNLVNG
jgi:predicted nucleic acid-binding protein